MNRFLRIASFVSAILFCILVLAFLRGCSKSHQVANQPTGTPSQTAQATTSPAPSATLATQQVAQVPVAPAPSPSPTGDPLAKARADLEKSKQLADQAKEAEKAANARQRAWTQEDAAQKATDLRKDIKQIESDMAVTKSDLEHCKHAARTWLKGSLLVEESIRADETTLRKLRAELEKKTKELSAIGG